MTAFVCESRSFWERLLGTNVVTLSFLSSAFITAICILFFFDFFLLLLRLFFFLLALLDLYFDLSFSFMLPIDAFLFKGFLRDGYSVEL
jgi:hypothetical protein